MLPDALLWHLCIKSLTLRRLYLFAGNELTAAGVLPLPTAHPALFRQHVSQAKGDRVWASGVVASLRQVHPDVDSK